VRVEAPQPRVDPLELVPVQPDQAPQLRVVFEPAQVVLEVFGRNEVVVEHEPPKRPTGRCLGLGALLLAIVPEPARALDQVAPLPLDDAEIPLVPRVRTEPLQLIRERLVAMNAELPVAILVLHENLGPHRDLPLAVLDRHVEPLAWRIVRLGLHVQDALAEAHLHHPAVHLDLVLALEVDRLAVHEAQPVPYVPRYHHLRALFCSTKSMMPSSPSVNQSPPRRRPSRTGTGTG